MYVFTLCRRLFGFMVCFWYFKYVNEQKIAVVDSTSSSSSNVLQHDILTKKIPNAMLFSSKYTIVSTRRKSSFLSKQSVQTVVHIMNQNCLRN